MTKFECGDVDVARYNVLTWDTVAGQYTEHDGMVNPCLNVTLAGLLRALRELKTFGYPCHRFRDEAGKYHSDWSVFVERVDDPVIDAMKFGVEILDEYSELYERLKWKPATTEDLVACMNSSCPVTTTHRLTTTEPPDAD